VPSLEAALELLKRLREVLGSSVSAFELMFREAFEGVVAFLGMARPARCEGACLRPDRGSGVEGGRHAGNFRLPA
jgi:hypothetical protein